MNAGGSDPLPLSCFRLRDQRCTVRGGVRPYRAVSGGPSTAEHVGSGGTAAVTTAASPWGGEEVLVWGQSPGEWSVSPARQQHVHATVMLFPVGPLHHRTPKQDAVGKVLPTSSHL